MKRILKLSIVLAGILIFLGCHSNDNEPDVVPGDVHYDLILENNTEEEIEIYIKGLAGEDFDRRGLLGAGEEMEFQFVIELTYVIRATYPGDALEDYFYEESISRSSPIDMVLSIND